MRIPVRELKENYILERDILGKTGKPIVHKQTVLTAEHICFIHAFLVEYVYISPKTANGDVIAPPNESVEELNAHQRQTAIGLLYEDMVAFIRTQFKKLEQQFPIDMPAIRQKILPLLDRVEEEKSFLHSIHLRGTKEKYIYHHSVSVSMLATFFARKTGYDRGESIQIGLAALLSDSGMTQIDSHIRMSNRELTLAEIQIVHEHPLHSYRLVESIQTMNQGAKVAVLQHHERLNGTGYPLGVQGKRIHPYAQIIAVCDMYHAMASNRPYQQKKSTYQICEELWQERNVTLQGSIVEAFVEEFAPLSIGNEVVLTNTLHGKVVFIDPSEPLRPTIQLNDSGELYSLQGNRAVTIDYLYAV